MSTIKAILFDLDNSLINFMQMKEEACKSTVRAILNSELTMDEEETYTRLMKTSFALGLESDRAITEFLKCETRAIGFPLS